MSRFIYVPVGEKLLRTAGRHGERSEAIPAAAAALFQIQQQWPVAAETWIASLRSQ
jgi:hypothetical protein